MRVRFRSFRQVFSKEKKNRLKSVCLLLCELILLRQQSVLSSALTLKILRKLEVVDESS